MNDLVIRALTIEDLDDLRRLRLEALQHDPLVFQTVLEVEQKRAVDWYVWHLDNNLVAGVLLDGRLCGMSILTRTAHLKQSHRAVSSFTYITPAKRGLGLARKLKEFVFAEATAMGIRQCVTGVIAENVAMRQLNKSLGCEETHTERGAMLHDGTYYDLVYSIKYLV